MSGATSASPPSRYRPTSTPTPSKPRPRLNDPPGLVVLALVVPSTYARCAMANGKGRQRLFGTIRRLPSGRYQARYPGPDGVRRAADDTFGTKTEAQDWLTLKEAEILEGDWIDPGAAAVLVPDY